MKQTIFIVVYYPSLAGERVLERKKYFLNFLKNKTIN